MRNKKAERKGDRKRKRHRVFEWKKERERKQSKEVLSI